MTGTGGLTVSAVVRAKNKITTLGATLSSLRAQTVPVEIVVVDSGSTDGSLELAEQIADTVVRLEPQRFGYGLALNLGATAASGDVIAAVSAHTVLPSPNWLADALAGYEVRIDGDRAGDGDANDIAGTAGCWTAPDGTLLHGPRQVALSDLRLPEQAHWGLSNHASTVRRSVWEKFPFDEQLGACEDKEWMWRVLRAGYRIHVDPRLAVPIRHRRNDGYRALYARAVREQQALTALLALPAPPLSELARSWWQTPDAGSLAGAWRRRLDAYRAVELAGFHAGGHCAAPSRGEHPGKVLT